MKKIIEIKNFLTEEECDEIISLSKNFDLNEANTTYPTSNYTLGKKDDKFRQSKIAYIESSNFENLTKKILNKINEYKLFNEARYSDILGYSFNEYTKNNFLEWHADDAELTNGATITVVIELSNGYDGGIFEYKMDNIEHSFEKGKGSMYIFDSEIVHRVTKITKGMRYSINCWPVIQIKQKSQLL